MGQYVGRDCSITRLTCLLGRHRVAVGTGGTAARGVLVVGDAPPRVVWAGAPSARRDIPRWSVGLPRYPLSCWLDSGFPTLYSYCLHPSSCSTLSFPSPFELLDPSPTPGSSTPPCDTMHPLPLLASPLSILAPPPMFSLPMSPPMPLQDEPFATASPATGLWTLPDA